MNDFLAEWTGSEILALEVAQHFDATMSSFWCAEPMKSLLADWRPLDEIDLSEYDLVWAQQHAVFPLLDRMEAGDARPFIIWVSLSPFDVMDNIPKTILDAYADLIVCNSQETAEARGAEISFGNASPNPFHFQREERKLSKILFVSNNQPAEMVEAERLLKARGYETRFLGRNREFKILEPSDLKWADCVVTIGKTVRYALASSTPVFIYDRFGGDGYLNAENYAINEANNFSGRPNCRKLTAAQIADEIIKGHGYWSPPSQPRLGDFLDRLASQSRKVNFVRHADLEAISAMSSAIGSWMSQTIAWRNTAYAWERTARDFQDGNIGWRRLGRTAWKKLRGPAHN
ncbi:MAG: hypothetical protein M3Q19_11935 [Pseudomonadota bacterium]|nr:hypothetical protein [Pseudomonadota bacterium]